MVDDPPRLLPATREERSVASVDKTVFDPNEILEMVGGSTALMKQMLQKFDVMPKLRKAEDALAEADATKLRAATHAMKGELRYIQAHRAAELALGLEEEARALEAEQHEHAADRSWTWSRECTERLTVMASTLCAEAERVGTNRLAALAELQ